MVSESWQLFQPAVVMNFAFKFWNFFTIYFLAKRRHKGLERKKKNAVTTEDNGFEKNPEYMEIPQPLSSSLCIAIYTHAKAVKNIDLLVSLARKLASMEGKV